MTEPTDAPSARQLVALVVLVAVGVAGFVTLYALTPAEDRGGLLDRLSTLLPALAAVGTGAAAWLGIRRVRSEHGQALAQISYQTNGVLTKRIRDAVSEALAVTGVGDRRHHSDPHPDPTPPSKGAPDEQVTPPDHTAQAGAA